MSVLLETEDAGRAAQGGKGAVVFYNWIINPTGAAWMHRALLE